MAKVQKRAIKGDVFLNGVAVNYLVCTDIGRSQGGRSLDYATLVVAPHPTMGAGFNVKDMALLEDLSQKQCTIKIRDEGGSQRVVHWGFVDAKSVTIDRSEYQAITSRLQSYHFGEPIQGMTVWSVFQGKAVDTLEQIVFNPQLDGRAAGNRSGKPNPDNLSFLFLNPECQRTTKAIETNSPGATEPPGYWSLVTAAHYLCWVGNPAQTYVENPTLPELFFTLSGDEEILRNHSQPFGEYLPANLDALLEPYGYSWKIDLAGSKPKIAVFKRGSGFPVYAKLAAVGEWADLATSNAEDISVTTDVANSLANSMRVYGDTVMVEYTVELVPGWLPAYDLTHTTSPSSLDLHGTNTEWETDPNLARVWRDWVLNEAGDYTGIRDRAGYSGPFDFNAITGLPLCLDAKRRKLLPCITIGSDLRPIGEHHGIVVEFFQWDRDPTSTTAFLTTGSWQPIEEATDAASGTIQILDKECGIRFCGALFPRDLADYGATGAHPARIRVTATVEMDARVGAVLTAGASANNHRVVRVIDVGSRFKRRWVRSKFVGAGAASTEVSDFRKAEKLATELLSNWNQASINGTVALVGCDLELANDCVGKSFGGIQGRGIDFQTTTGAPLKYPSITAVKLDFVNQRTILTLDTYKRDRV